MPGFFSLAVLRVVAPVARSSAHLALTHSRKEDGRARLVPKNIPRKQAGACPRGTGSLRLNPARSCQQKHVLGVTGMGIALCDQCGVNPSHQQAGLGKGCQHCSPSIACAEGPFPAAFGVQWPDPFLGISPSPCSPDLAEEAKCQAGEKPSGKGRGRSFPSALEAADSSHPSQVLCALPNLQTHLGVPSATNLLLLKHTRRRIRQGKRGRSLCDSQHLVRPQGFSPPDPSTRRGCPVLAPRAIPSLFPSPQPSVWGKGRLDKTSPFCSTKLVSQQHRACNYYFLKDEPSSYRQKSPLLSELEFDVLTTVFVPRLLEERARQEGEREI